MGKKINIKQYYSISDNLVSKEIEGELVIVPLISGIGNLDSEMYSLNRTGSAVWKKLDGKSSIENILHELVEEFDSEFNLLKNDIIELMEDLLKKELIFEIQKSG